MFDKFLILSPHPDDEALSCGGLISWAKLHKKDVEVMYFSTVLIGTNACRQMTGKITNDKIRKNEICEVAAKGGFSYSIHSFTRLNHMMQKEMISRIEMEIEDLKPDAICIPSKQSCNQDHRAIFDAAHTALRPLPRDVRHFVPTILEYEEPYGWYQGSGFHPNFYWPMKEDDLNFKIDLISLHETQLRDPPSTRSLYNVWRVAEMRGAESGQQYAEAYKIHRMAP